MSADIFPFPARPALRLVEPARPVPPAARAHFESELRQISTKLLEAAGHFRMLASEPVADTAAIDGAEALEAALFHALTLKGCSSVDRPLREMLLRRLSQREEACRD